MDGSADAGSACEPTFESVRAQIFLPRCATEGCHAADSPAAGLDLTIEDPTPLIGAVSAACDGELRVSPGDPLGSTLYTKLTDAPPCGKRMPLGGDPLSRDELLCVVGWIESEASTCETCGGTACVDLDTDPAQCGACGSACPAGVACVDGTCDCPGNAIVCDDVCVPIGSDPANCGDCGVACGGGEVCFMGTCGSDCGGLTQCGQACVDTTSDAANCGECGMACGVGQACVNGTCACDGPQASFTTDVEPVLAAGCATMGCHGFPAPKEGLDLRAGQAYDALVGVPSQQCGARALVAPGEPENSYLLHKLRGVELCSGTRMPKGANPLPAAEVAAIENWICSGAQP